MNNRQLGLFDDIGNQNIATAVRAFGPLKRKAQKVRYKKKK